MLTKLIVTGNSREDALKTSKNLLFETIVEGMPTTLDFHRWLIDQKDFEQGNVHIHWLEKKYSGQSAPSFFTGPLKVPEIENKKNV
jgi:biotin carboxylase